MPTEDRSLEVESLTLVTCGQCRFWQHDDQRSGFCRRHAPAASDRAYQIARWAETRATDACGEGEPMPVDLATAPRLADQICRGCLYWNRPGIGIDPPQRGDRLSAWWQQAGWCRRFAPRPGVDIGDHAFWRVTHASDHCFDGKPG